MLFGLLEPLPPILAFKPSTYQLRKLRLLDFRTQCSNVSSSRSLLARDLRSQCCDELLISVLSCSEKYLKRVEDDHCEKEHRSTSHSMATTLNLASWSMRLMLGIERPKGRP